VVVVARVGSVAAVDAPRPRPSPDRRDDPCTQN